MTDFAHGPSTIRLGDLEVPRLGYGAMQIPGPMVWGEPKDPDRVRKVLRRVVELGIKLIDTSWYYGPLVSNRFIRETLHPYPKDLVLVTKLGGKRTPDKGWAPALNPEELFRGCDEDLRTLELDRVDLVHLRWIEPSEVSFKEALDAMIELKKRGKIRHIGISNVTLAQLREAMERTPIVSVENLYNVAAGEKHVDIPGMQVAGQEELLDSCTKKGIAFFPFFSLALPFGPKLEAPVIADIAKDHDATESQVALAWSLARSPMMLPIPGTSSPEHLEENWNARKLLLSTNEIARISAARN